MFIRKMVSSIAPLPQTRWGLFQQTCYYRSLMCNVSVSLTNTNKNSQNTILMSLTPCPVMNKGHPLSVSFLSKSQIPFSGWKSHVIERVVSVQDNEDVGRGLCAGHIWRCDWLLW